MSNSSGSRLVYGASMSRMFGFLVLFRTALFLILLLFTFVQSTNSLQITSPLPKTVPKLQTFTVSWARDPTDPPGTWKFVHSKDLKFGPNLNLDHDDVPNSDGQSGQVEIKFGALQFGTFFLNAVSLEKPHSTFFTSDPIEVLSSRDTKAGELGPSPPGGDAGSLPNLGNPASTSVALPGLTDPNARPKATPEDENTTSGPAPSSQTGGTSSPSTSQSTSSKSRANTPTPSTSYTSLADQGTSTSLPSTLPTSATTNPSATAGDSSQNNGTSKKSATIAASIIGAAIVIALAVFFYFIYSRRRRRRLTERSKAASFYRDMMVRPGGPSLESNGTGRSRGRFGDGGEFVPGFSLVTSVSGTSVLGDRERERQDFPPSSA